MPDCPTIASTRCPRTRWPHSLQVLLGLLLLPPVVAGATAILQRSSPYIAIYLWLFLLGVSLFGLTVYPTLIAPLFNKFTPLEKGPLRWVAQGGRESLPLGNG